LGVGLAALCGNRNQAGSGKEIVEATESSLAVRKTKAATWLVDDCQVTKWMTVAMTMQINLIHAHRAVTSRGCAIRAEPSGRRLWPSFLEESGFSNYLVWLLWLLVMNLNHTHASASGSKVKSACLKTKQDWLGQFKGTPPGRWSRRQHTPAGF
jgi:hypothetical protein